MQFLASAALTFVRVLGSTVVGEHGAVLLGGEGAVGDVDDPLGDGSSDKFTDVEQYNGPIIWRPRPPETVSGKQIGVEGIGARLGGSTVPLALRDLRFNRRFANPKPGSVALVGYGGGFLAFDDTTNDSGSGKASKATLYVPYAFDSSGVPAKAHIFYVDPDNDAIGLVHGEGMAVVLDGATQSATVRVDGDSYLTAKPGELFVNFPNIILNGNTILGGTVGAPLLPGIASPPSTRVFIGP